MRKLNPPNYAAMELYDAAVAGLSDDGLRAKFEENRDHIIAAIGDFDSETTTKTWCNLPRAAHGHSGAIIVGNLTKAELVALYDDGVVRSNSRPRTIYDQIKLAAYNECPYCGGIGEMGEEGELGTADHFLAKARFPAYSVFALNLVPACQVCNRGMGSNFPTDPNLQPLHPYLDELHFFNEKWTIAAVREGDPIVVDFDVNPPAAWPLKDRLRVSQHFIDCNLRTRYRSRVPQELSPLVSQRRTTLSTLSSNDFREHLLVVANVSTLPINGWKRTLYKALAESDWFCEMDFN
jgi:hypothetical protein